MAFLGQEEQIREFQSRFRYIYIAISIAFSLLLSRLVFLQILEGDKLRRFSEENRIRRIKVEAPRGMIFDRNRKLLIDNRPAFDLEIVPQYLKDQKKLLEVAARLSPIIKVDEKDIVEMIERAKTQAPYLSAKLKTELTRDEVAQIETWKIEMPGIEVKTEIKRTNVYGEVASHMLGYIGEVSNQELPQLNKTSKNKYKLGDNVGKSGLEQKMEEWLRGQDGEELKEVDAVGRVKLDKGKSAASFLDTLQDKPAVPGNNLILTVDQDLQLAAETAFEGKTGAAVAIDPKTGQILAMLSRPSFDPTEFSRGIPATVWNKLITNENHPLRDKTLQDHYSPGSTFKVFTALTALAEGAIDENTRFVCTGNIKVGNQVRHCGSKHGHGELGIIGAITHSCNVFFYRVAQKLRSVDDIAKWATFLGLGARTGVPLPREVPGLIPTEAWKMSHFHQEWNPGETLSVAIGQSFVLTTAIQMANAYAAIANGGSLYKPYLVQSIESSDGKSIKSAPTPELVRKVNLPPHAVELVKQGLYNVVNTPQGTAFRYRLPGMDMAGKTGTVQASRMSQDRLYGHCEAFKYKDRHHGWFVGFAPANDPVIAVAVITEHTCHGGSGSGPIAKAIIKTYLEKYFPNQYGPKVIAEKLKHKGVQVVPAVSVPVSQEAEEDSVVVDDDAVTPSDDHENSSDTLLSRPLKPGEQE